MDKTPSNGHVHTSVPTEIVKMDTSVNRGQHSHAADSVLDETWVDASVNRGPDISRMFITESTSNGLVHTFVEEIVTGNIWMHRSTNRDDTAMDIEWLMNAIVRGWWVSEVNEIFK